MDILLTEENIKIRDKCKEFANQKLRKIAEKYGETSDIPAEMVNEMAKEGFFNLYLPLELGGEGIKSLKICLAREQFAGIYCPADVTLAMQGLGGYPIALAGNSEQKNRYLKKVCNGEYLSAFGLTEPDAGSDVRSMRTFAEQTKDGFVLNGKKRFISNGYAADYVVVFARTNDNTYSAFIVEKGSPGFSVSKRINTIAPHDLTELHFNNCYVPKENLLGEVGQGLKIALETLSVFRMTVGAAAIGIGQEALNEAISFAKKRVQFGKPIFDFQAIQFKLAEMATILDASRALVYRAAIKKDRGEKNVQIYSSMAKYYATESAFKIVDESLQIHGGVGVVCGTTIERLYREIRALRIYEGTSEIQHLIIANELKKSFA